MANRTASLLPSTETLLRQFGERLMLARRRRRLSAKQVAERAGMSPITLRRLEQGSPGVTLGAYASVMQMLGIETEFSQLGKADPTGRDLQDASIMPGASKRGRTGRLPATALESADTALPAPSPGGLGTQRSSPSNKRVPPRSTEVANRGAPDIGLSQAFVDPQALLRLIEVPGKPERPTRKTKG